MFDRYQREIAIVWSYSGNVYVRVKKWPTEAPNWSRNAYYLIRSLEG